MVEQTRYARVQESIAQLRNDGATRCVSLRTQARSSVEALFRDKQRMMASAVAEERRPGLFVFAAHLQYGHVARMWLEASAQPRAGLIGRHDEVDLALPLDDSLSLRHLMFVVRRRAAGVQLVVLDLETQHGLQLESGAPVRLVEAPGPLIVCASDFVFFCVPTGQPAPWLSESRDPWATLMPRCVTRQVPRQASSREPLVGRVELGSAFGVRSATFGNAALGRGLLIGRAARCDVVSPINSVSRVHAVLLRLEEELFIIDAGSTNGTWRVDREVKIDRLHDGDVVMLGQDVTLCWRDSH